MKFALHALFVLVAIASNRAAAQQCSSWSPGFAGSLPAGLTGFAVHDDGGGERLFASVVYHPFARIVSWDGERWDVVQESTVATFGSFASGTVAGAQALFAFRSASGSHSVLRWDGTSATDLGVLPHFSTQQSFPLCLEVLDDGSGSALYAGGWFVDLQHLNGTNYLVKWDGVAWSAVGNDPPDAVRGVCVHDDGNGPTLYVATNSGVARLDGATWTLLPWTLPFAARWPGGSLVSIDWGAGPRLVVACERGAAAWDGAAWSNLTGVISPDSLSGACLADFGAGPRVVFHGEFSALGGVACAGIASFDGSSFAPLGAGLDSGRNSGVRRMQTPSGLALVVGGLFETAGGAHAPGLARWDGASWSGYGQGLPAVSTNYGPGIPPKARPLALHDDGTGEHLYAAERGVRRWDGTTWTRLGPEAPFLSPAGQGSEIVAALASADVGTGPRLYAAGYFAPSVYRGIAEWNGSAWTNVGAGSNVYGLALAAHDDGSGPRLFVGGFATDFSGRLSAWNGSSWALRVVANKRIQALTRFDDGGGPELYAAGEFTTIGGTPVQRVFRWDGVTWAPLGLGIGSAAPGEIVYTLCAFGGELYAGGLFATAGGSGVSNLARWNGSAWSDVPGGGPNGAVLSLAVHDDGRGPALYASGEFDTVGGIVANQIARFDGALWEPVDGGLDKYAYALLSFDDDGDGDAELFAGGPFEVAGGRASNGIARLSDCTNVANFCAGDGSLTDHTTPCPCGNNGAPGRGCGHSFDASGAQLSADGATTQDAVVLHSEFAPATSFTLFMQHASPGDTVFHDGVLCAGGALVRLRGRSAAGGEAFFPNTNFAQDATTTLSLRGGVTIGSGATRYYAAWFRNASSTFCPPTTANVTNGVRVIW